MEAHNNGDRTIKEYVLTRQNIKIGIAFKILKIRLGLEGRSRKRIPQV